MVREDWCTYAHMCVHTYVVVCERLLSVCDNVLYIPSRDNRVRVYLGGRYDNRQGVFDWDYHMKLQEMVR